MRPLCLRLALCGAAVLLIQACEPVAQQPHTTALLIDHQSLPGHRHAETLDDRQREFLAMQRPGDSMILANSPAPPDAGSILSVTLPDRPLLATRTLRLVRDYLQETSEERWGTLGDVLALATMELQTADSRRCLYLALDPGTASMPSAPEAFQGREQVGQGWTAFLLMPDAWEQRNLSLWTTHLHGLGAEKIQWHPLSSPLPKCR